MAITHILALATGNGENTNFNFVQSSAATTWNVTHSLGYYPITRVYNNSNEEIQPLSIVHNDIYSLTITFSVATAGSARMV